MAVRKYVGDRVSCLSGDAKPTDLADGAVLFETDTGVYYVRTGGAWVGMGGASPIIIYPWFYNAITQGTWALTAISGILNHMWYNSSAANADQIDYKVFLGAGTYTFGLQFYRFTNRGILDLLIDGASQGTLDLYGADNATQLAAIADIVVTAPGLKTLSIKCNGKNGSSSGYVISLVFMSLMRTA